MEPYYLTSYQKEKILKEAGEFLDKMPVQNQLEIGFVIEILNEFAAQNNNLYKNIKAKIFEFNKNQLINPYLMNDIVQINSLYYRVNRNGDRKQYYNEVNALYSQAIQKKLDRGFQPTLENKTAPKKPVRKVNVPGPLIPYFKLFDARIKELNQLLLGTCVVDYKMSNVVGAKKPTNLEIEDFINEDFTPPTMNADMGMGQLTSLLSNYLNFYGKKIENLGFEINFSIKANQYHVLGEQAINDSEKVLNSFKFNIENLNFLIKQKNIEIAVTQPLTMKQVRSVEVLSQLANKDFDFTHLLLLTLHAESKELLVAVGHYLQDYLNQVSEAGFVGCYQVVTRAVFASTTEGEEIELVQNMILKNCLGSIEQLNASLRKRFIQIKIYKTDKSLSLEEMNKLLHIKFNTNTILKNMDANPVLGEKLLKSHLVYCAMILEKIGFCGKFNVGHK
ncbi:MAG: hypothetical protein LW832_08145 [Parachlamydia sp.]|jgi:hypothetical protein|nr:hypothetical protein [Parachlamydia sp.]